MSLTRQRSLRLLGLNVVGLRIKAKGKTVFKLLHRDRWDVVLLQETHHSSQADSEKWVGERGGGLRANWGHGSHLSRGVAVLISQSAAARLSDIQL